MIEGSCHCGAVEWKVNSMPDSTTAFKCTVCRRFGVPWACDFEGQGISASGTTTVYVWGDKSPGFYFCPGCGCVAHSRSVMPREDGRRRIAVNLRLLQPDPIARPSVDCFEGLVNFEDPPRDGRCMADLWFTRGMLKRPALQLANL